MFWIDGWLPPEILDCPSSILSRSSVGSCIRMLAFADFNDFTYECNGNGGSWSECLCEEILFRCWDNGKEPTEAWFGCICDLMSYKLRWAIVEFVLGICKSYWVGVPLCFNVTWSSLLDISIWCWDPVGLPTFCIWGIKSFADLIAYSEAFNPGRVVGLTGASTMDWICSSCCLRMSWADGGRLFECIMTEQPD